MTDILIFGGTTEGRELTDILSKNDIKITYCTATETGAKMIEKNDNILVNIGRMDESEMTIFMSKKAFKFVIDATHPYADIVSKNIHIACEKTGLKYIRLLREESNVDYGIYVDDIKSACMLSEGNVLATTGSKQANEYQALFDYKNRLYIRVLNIASSVDECLNADIPKDHIIESFGAVSLEENIETIKKYNIKTLITKDGGKKGGFYEKLEAAKQCKIKFIVIKRPVSETGYSLEEIVNLVLER